jgi:hypothetical protein
MRPILVLSVVVLSLVGCATPEKTETAQADTAERERCHTVLTGSRIPQCNRGEVKQITRDELERNGDRISVRDLPPEAAPPRSR